MSSDDGWLIQNNKDGKFVLQHYSASANRLPDPNDPRLKTLQAAGGRRVIFDTLEEAVLQYNVNEDVDYPSEYGLTFRLTTKVEKMQLEKFNRKAFPIEAIQITEENFEEIAQWLESDIVTENDGTRYIKVDVKNPLTPKQSKGYLTDWITVANQGYKVYTDKAFHSAFEPAKEEISA